MEFKVDESTQKIWDTEIYTICSFCEKEYTFNQYIQSASIWVNPKEKKYGKITPCQCGVNLFSERWNIVSKVDVYYISTAHLPIAHGGVERKDWFDYGYWYETMFWSEHTKGNREFHDFQMRYHTREEAIRGQKFVVDNINKILESPDKYPQGIIDVFFNGIKAAEDQRKNIDPHVKRNLR